MRIAPRSAQPLPKPRVSTQPGPNSDMVSAGVITRRVQTTSRYPIAAPPDIGEGAGLILLARPLPPNAFSDQTGKLGDGAGRVGLGKAEIAHHGRTSFGGPERRFVATPTPAAARRSAALQLRPVILVRALT
jgi:hypothetical protein